MDQKTKEQKTATRSGFSTSVRNLTVYVTEHCNFACTYCFQRNRSQPKRMQWDTAKHVLEWYLQEASEDDNHLDLTFFGGEPLLEFKLIRRMVEYGETLADKMGKTIRFSATSNGSLFTEEVGEFWKQHKMSLLLSLDGAPDTQDAHRLPREKGISSSALLEKAFPNILDASADCTVRLTVTPENADRLVENLDYLYQHGFRSLAHYPVEAGWDEDSLLKLDKAYRAAANWYLQKIVAGENIYLGLYSLVAKRILEWRDMDSDQQVAPEAPCGAGKGYLGVAIDGTIYPCHRFVSLDDFKGRFPLGDVKNGLNKLQRNQFVRITNQHMLGCNTVCRHCVANSICRGGCLVQNLEMTGDMLMPMPAQQFISTMYYEIAKDSIAVLEQSRPDLIPAFLGNKNQETPTDAHLKTC